MGKATPEELIRAHNEGEQWAKDDDTKGFVDGLVHELSRDPSGTGFFSTTSTEKSAELHEAFEKGVDHHRSQ